MRTIGQTSDKIRNFVRNCSIAIVSPILRASLVVAKYSYWFLSVFIFFSCQKNLTQTNDSVNIINQNTVENFIVIDTLKYSLASHISSLSLSSLGDSSMYGRIHDKMNRFYHANSLRTKWMNINGPTPLYYALIDHLKNATQYGLNPYTYNVDQIEQPVSVLYKNKFASSKDIIDMDIRITEMFFLFAIHLNEGRISDPGYYGKIWIRHNRTIDKLDANVLLSVKNAPELDEVIKSLQPAHEQYEKLQTQLARYRSLEANDAELPISSRENIKAGTRHAAIPAIRKKLWSMDIQVSNLEKNEITTSTDSLYYDAGLVSDIKIFQQRHGLVQDGIIGGKTLAYLKQSFKEKADLIALNMERMRWLPGQYATQHIRVNIPAYKLRIYEQGKQTLEMNIIVGAVSTATPVFIDTLEHVVLSPTWTVPPSLVKEEFLPRLKKNKMYYAKRKDFIFYKNGVEIDPATEDWNSVSNVHAYRIVQKPGPGNALGLAKFIMPNHMNIYLHDTPDHKLFSQSFRALSHGCIRLDDPARLAAYLLQGESGWDLSRIKKAMISGKPTKISLRKQYQVNLEYQTVWVDDQGNLNFGEDIYGHDKKQLQRLNLVSKIENLVASR